LEEKKGDGAPSLSTMKETSDPEVQVVQLQHPRRMSDTAMSEGELERERERQDLANRVLEVDNDRPPMSTTSFTSQTAEPETIVTKSSAPATQSISAVTSKPNPSQPLSSQIVVSESEVHQKNIQTQQEKPRISLAKAAPVVSSPPQSASLGVVQKPPSGTVEPVFSGYTAEPPAQSDGVDRTVYRAEVLELGKDKARDQERARLAAMSLPPPSSGLSEKVDPLGKILRLSFYSSIEKKF